MRKFVRNALRYLKHQKQAPVDVREVFKHQWRRGSPAKKRAMKERWDSTGKMVDYLQEIMADTSVIFHNKRNDTYTIKLRTVGVEPGHKASKINDVAAPRESLDPRGDLSSISGLCHGGDTTRSVKTESSTSSNQNGDDAGDIFALNNVILSSCSVRGPDKSANVVPNNESQNNTNVAEISTPRNSLKLKAKWPLARPRVSVPYAVKYRNTIRHLQMKQLLGRLTCDDDAVSVQAPQNKATSSRNGRSSLEELRLELETLRESENRRPDWLCQGITVRVVSRRLGRKFLRQTADVLEVKQGYTALIRFHYDGSVLYADQAHLETAIVREPRHRETRVFIVNGAYRGCTGTLEDRPSGQAGKTHTEGARGSLTVRIDKGVFNGRVLHNVQADDVASLVRTNK
ncbi:hypothetical protein EGW08_013767 [Elysia chlorotica]|uniref:KN17 SH3-like domain-containing protein n=1 Tax=Elysia chlorotica TaxID=188477 RepID=A0A3S0ZYQ7_ELYCH|nr:hypothetical protein EGW08_013767 [Elysia chlorotica]